jgi:tetratricopeptide (TPR) repeat protein
MASSTPAPILNLDIAPPSRWRRFVPSWLRSLIWSDSAADYDAFLSYSWAADKEIAPVIQSVIHRFLCPWYKVRARAVFRDLSSLPAGSSLERELFSRLDRSANLLVLANPEAANSRGMELEAQHWFSRNVSGEVLIIVTAWQGPRPPTWTDIRDTLLPPTLRRHFASVEPLWIPLYHRRAEILADPHGERVRGQVIEDLKQIFLCFYPGATWEELRGEERSQKRRAMGLMGGAAALFLLAALMILAELVNVVKARNEADANYKSAVDVATATGSIVKRQLQPDGGEQSRTILASSLLKAPAQTFEDISANFENPGAAFSRVQLMDLLWNNYFILGDYARASKAAQTEFSVAAKYEPTRPRKGEPSRADWLRFMCRAQENLADDARVTGDRGGEENYFRQAVFYAKPLGDATPAGAWENEVPRAYERFGDFLRDERRFPEALAEFQKFLDFQTSRKPDDVASQRNLAVVLGKMGDMLLQRGDLDGAEREYRANVAISERLVQTNANQPDLWRGVAVSHERLGFLERKQTKYSDAIKDYRQELEVAQRLTKDKAVVEWARDEALANEGLGDVELDQNQLLDASRHYEAYLASIMHAFDRAKANRRIQREVAVAYQRLGEVKLRLRRDNEARENFQNCVKTAEGATVAFEPRNPDPQDVRSYCQGRMAAMAPPAEKR